MGSADKYGGVLLVSFAFADGCSFYAKTGANVSPRSGDCTTAGKPAEDDDGKSGLERGVYREDKRVVSEMNWKNSKREGAGFYFDYNDRRIFAIFKNDLAEGPVQVFFKENKLLCQMEFKEGKPQGAVGELFPGGKLKDAYEIRGDREGRGRGGWGNGRLRSERRRIDRNRSDECGYPRPTASSGHSASRPLRIGSA